MKETLQQIIYRLFTGSMVQFIKNWDDTYEGFEFNPNDPRELIQVKYTMTSSKLPDYEKKIKSKLIETFGDKCYQNGFVKKSSIEKAYSKLLNLLCEGLIPTKKNLLCFSLPFQPKSFP